MKKIPVNIFEQKEEFDGSEILKESELDLSEVLEYPPVSISLGEKAVGQKLYPIPFATNGNFSCICGASKSKKSFLKSLINSVYIGGQSNLLSGDLKGHRTTDLLLLDFDTEQGNWHAQNVFKRVLNIVGYPYENYRGFALRKYDSKERFQFIEWCFLESDFKNDIGFASIDGVADLVSDTNSLEQATKLTNSLLKWSDVSKAHIVTILHTAYGIKKPTGHLGSSVLKKAETVCFVEPEDDKVKISFDYTRSFGIDQIYMRVNDRGLPEIISEYDGY